MGQSKAYKLGRDARTGEMIPGYLEEKQARHNRDEEDEDY